MHSVSRSKHSWCGDLRGDRGPPSAAAAPERHPRSAGVKSDAHAVLRKEKGSEMHLRVRLAECPDLNGIMGLLSVLYKEDVGKHLRNLVEEYVVSPDHVVFLATNETDVVAGVLIGSYRIDIDYECRAAFLNAIIVEETMRRQGIGKMMMQEFTHWAAGKNCTVLQVLNGRREFFEGIGFRERPAVLHQVPIDELKT